MNPINPMRCDDVQTLLDAYLDDELDLVTSAAVAGHLKTCPQCAPTAANRQTMQRLFRAEREQLYLAPAGRLNALETRLRTAISQEIHQMAPKRAIKTSLPQRQLLTGARFGWAAAALLAVLLIAVLTVGAVRSQTTPVSDNTALAQQVLTSHIRSLMADHLLDVVSTDLHTIKPWFNGRLDFSPPVIDLASTGFPLVGGRLDYIDQHSVAALVYQRQKHFINVFVWPSSETSNEPLQQFSNQGYNEFYWSQNQVDYWAVSDLNAADLHTFVNLIQSNPGNNDK